VSDEPTYFNSESEIVGRGLTPGNKGFLGGQAIEAIVKLHGVELLSIELQPL
jgi:hypothetical protein